MRQQRLYATSSVAPRAERMRRYRRNASASVQRLPRNWFVFVKTEDAIGIEEAKKTQTRGAMPHTTLKSLRGTSGSDGSMILKTGV